MIHFQRSQSTVFKYFHKYTKSVSIRIFTENSSFSKARSKRDEKETGPFSPLDQDTRILCTCLGTHEAPKMDPS